MLEDWEEFAMGPIPSKADRVYVSVNYKGQFLLSKGAFQALGEPQAVALLFNRWLFKIGIRPCSPFAPNAFPLKPRQKAHSRLIHASTFCRNYGIKPPHTLAFHGIEVDKDGILTLDLTKTSRVSRVNVGR